MDLTRYTLALMFSLYVPYRGYKKSELYFSGVCTAVAIGFISMISGYQFGCVLLMFYFSGARLSKLGATRKYLFDENYKLGGRRSASQMLATSAIGTCIAMIFYIMYSDITSINPTEINFQSTYQKGPSILLTSYIGHYACNTADMWSSELGRLSSTKPILITTLQRVPKGTNGGISLFGTFAAIAGGAFIGLGYFLLSILLVSSGQINVIPFASVMGLLGCTIDSILGAIFQRTMYDTKCHHICKAEEIPDASYLKYLSYQHISGWNVLSNTQVNILSILCTTILSAPIASTFFF